MKRVILKLAGGEGKKLYEHITHSPDFEVIGFTDKKAELWDTEYDGRVICSSFEVIEHYRKKKVDAVLLPYGLKMDLLQRMVEELRILGLNKQHILIAKPEFYDCPTENHLCTLEDYRYLPYLEFHVADHCNLNCKGCVHFSPLVEGEVFPDFSEMEKDFYQLRKVVEYVGEIHILGGEPLLNKDLDKYVRLVRKVYPYTQLKVITNGLLLKQMSEKVIASLRDNHASIGVSLYKPMFHKIEEVIKHIRSLGIDIGYSKPIEGFNYTFDEEGGHLSGARQINCTCPNLYKGHIAICPPIAYLKYFNQCFGEDYEEEEGLIDIYDPKLDFHGLIKKLHTPVNICDKCLYVSKEDSIPLKWEQTQTKNIEDYVYRRKK